MENKKVAIIIGAGPAGLTAAYELLMRSDIKPIILERSNAIGGLAKTIDYKGYKMDIGPHRFFSKSDRVMNWWLNILPLQGTGNKSENAIEITYQNNNKQIRLSDSGPNPDEVDKVMLVKDRFTRIFYLKRFFNYPVSLGMEMVRNLGMMRIIKILWSYVKIKMAPIRDEHSLEDFMINRFGRELYTTFFKDYTEKVWGIACNRIKPEWGAQRIKGLSITKVFAYAIKKILGLHNADSVEHFLYPKLGTGQLWEEVAKIIIEKGGELHFNQEVRNIKTDNNQITSVQTQDLTFSGDYFISTMPVKELIHAMESKPPKNVVEVADGLIYRDYISVGLLLKKLNYQSAKTKGLIQDNWIYIQEPDVKLGRIVIYNNFSLAMLADSSKVWLGLDYFCDEGDMLWQKTDAEMKTFGIEELIRLGFIHPTDVLDSVIIKEKKSYPAYFGTYDRFSEIREFTDTLTNLFLIGRNGMHQYNNQDHSMLCAMAAIDAILAGTTSKDSIWAVKAE